MPFAMVFPGQGSQRPGMGAAWRGDASWSLVERMSQVTGRDIGWLLTEAGADELKATANAQLATFTLCAMILDAALSALAGTQSVAVAGHSLGEYSALVAAGVLSLEDAAGVVAERGAAMEVAAALNPGTMVAVLGLEPEAVASACAEVAGGGAWVANDNAPGQVVIAGTASGVSQAASNARAQGAKRIVPLAVGGAFHTPLMAPAQGRLDAALAGATFADGAIDCVANVDASAHRDGGSWRRLLSDQLCSPVRWRPSLLRLHSLGARSFVEMGPGTELSGMVKRTVGGATRVNVAVPGDLANLVSLVGDGGSG